MDPLQHYYEARAGVYDRVYEKPERQADLREIEAWLPPRFAGRRLLEVACGTGYWTQFVAPVAASVVAIDAAEPTLAIARQRVRGANVRFERGDAYALPPADPPYEAAFAGFWFSHVPKAKRRAFLHGLHAVLAPGALVVMIDNLHVDGSSTPIADTDADGDTWQRRPLDDGSVHRVLKNFPDEAELRACVTHLATDVQVRSWSHYWVWSYRKAP